MSHLRDQREKRLLLTSFWLLLLSKLFFESVSISFSKEEFVPLTKQLEESNFKPTTVYIVT